MKTPRNSLKSYTLALFGLALLAILIAGIILASDNTANAFPYETTPPSTTINTEAPTVDTEPTEHECDYTIFVIQQPTCEENGLKEGKCDCGAIYQQSIDAIGHSFSNWQVRIAVGCEQAGEEYRICVCGLEETRIIDALQHNYTDWKIQTEPTCVKDGEETRNCTRCSNAEYRVIDKLGHQYEYSSAKQPTTTTEGYDIYFCVRCGNERRVSLPMLKAIDVDKCGESLLGKVLPNAPYPEFTEKMFDRWARELTQKESYAEGLIRFPGVFQNSWTPIREWEMPYRYITNPFPYTAYKHEDYSEFYCWGSEKEYAEQRAVYQRVAEILKELGIDNNTTKKEAIIRINKWICDYKYYQDSDEWGHDETYFSLFRQDGVCHNYSLAFQVLCLGAGIECHYYSSSEMNHAWNKVYFSDGSYLWVDCTWNDSARPNRYLLISTEQLLKDHQL